MATKRITPLLAILGIAAGGVAIQKLPIGPRYHQIMVEAQGDGKTFAQLIDNIKILVNGKVQQEFTPGQLDDRNKLNGTQWAFTDMGAGNKSIITIYFAEPWRKEYSITDGLAWRSQGLSSFELQFKVNAAAPAGTTINCTAVTDKSILQGTNGQALPNQLVAIKKVRPKQFQLTGTLTESFDLDPGLYQVLSFYDPHIEEVVLKLDGFEFLDITKAQADKTLLDHDLVPVANRFDIVFDADDLPDSALPIVQGVPFQTKIYCADVDPDDATTNFPRNIVVMTEDYGAPN